MSKIQVTFVLHGHYAGKTVKLGNKYQFVDGKMTVVDTPEQMALRSHFLAVNWQAYPEGKQDGKRDIQADKIGDKQPEVSGDLQPNGEGTGASQQPADPGGGSAEDATGSAGVVPPGDGPPPGVNKRLEKALAKLDHNDDSHWNKDGKPALAAVEKLYGSSDVTRRDINEVAPGLVRKPKVM